MHKKNLFLMEVLPLHKAQKLRAKISNGAARLQLHLEKVWNKTTNATKKLLAEWIKSRN